MENPRPEKVAVVDEVRERLSAADAAILTEYRGLGVSEMAELRRALRAAGGNYKVYKNTLVRFAASDLGLTELQSLLEGPTAIAFVTGDAVGVAKALRDFGRVHPSLVVKGGVLGAKVLTAGDAAALADLPSRDELLARLAGGLAAPLRQFAGLLAALPRNMAYALQALIDERGGVPAPEPEAAVAETAEPAAEETAADASAPAAPAADEGEAPETAAETPEPAADAGDAQADIETPPDDENAAAEPEPAAETEPQEG